MVIPKASVIILLCANLCNGSGVPNPPAFVIRKRPGAADEIGTPATTSPTAVSVLMPHLQGCVAAHNEDSIRRCDPDPLGKTRGVCGS
ncbi:MAG: hypothetical protein QOJ99_3747 [Bryobacterales bacterium]|jgi:hypothetical protein|nr:hypothetical protein [Bryobacterales bacterium]